MICFDTHLLIWGIRGYAEPSQQEMIGRARRLIQHLDGKRERIMVPTVALAEYLVGVSPNNREKHLRAFEKHFELPSFDAEAAQLAAEIQQNKQLFDDVKSSTNTPRQCLKADIMIIATAITHDASKIITHEWAKFRRLADGKIDVEDIPDILEQDILFE